ncbi:MAG TPA: hypothetical protein VL282_05760 [Tepidisphaeraceae bacterium]|jgi:hypothetical protein|nr:hypothetical protein [Tepidisphaeraceae bacterium]
MRTILGILMFIALAGCADDKLRGEAYQPTDNDPPFGGGFPASHHPGGDPFSANSRRGEVRVRSDAPLTGDSSAQPRP